MKISYDAINLLAKAITGYCFSNGIVQEYNAAGCLNDEQMKALNKYMVNRIGFILQLHLEDQIEVVPKVLSTHAQICGHWDDVDTTEPEEELAEIIKNHNKQDHHVKQTIY